MASLLDGIKYCYLTIQFNINYLFIFSYMVELFFLTHSWDPNRYYHSGLEWITPWTGVSLDGFVSYSVHSFAGGSYPSAEMQSAYSTARTDWAVYMCMSASYIYIYIYWEASGRIVGVLWGVDARTCSILLSTFLCNCCLVSSSAV